MKYNRSGESCLFPLRQLGCCGLALLVLSSGCASPAKKPPEGARPTETTAEQVDAVKKVMGAMGGGREISNSDMKRVARDIQTDQESRSAVEKIIGVSGSPVIKYSPVTGKHYSGDLEYDPETGARLEVIKE